MTLMCLSNATNKDDFLPWIIQHNLSFYLGQNIAETVIFKVSESPVQFPGPCR